MFLEKLLNQHPVISFLYRYIEGLPCHNQELSNAVAKYTLEYLDKNSVTLEQAFEIYNNFIEDFNSDLQIFAKSQKYPYELGTDQRSFNRLEYDVVLLLSVLVSPHRYQLMETLWKQSPPASSACYIGCGPGIEIYLTQARFQSLKAFDAELNPLLKDIFPDVQFQQAYFPTDALTVKFDAIYLIEILEHLSDPLQLLRDSEKHLNDRGRIYLTTATNLPQYDHYYNFPADHTAFEAAISAMGLRIVLNSEIPHQYAEADIAAKNHYYILQK